MMASSSFKGGGTVQKYLANLAYKFPAGVEGHKQPRTLPAKDAVLLEQRRRLVLVWLQFCSLQRSGSDLCMVTSSSKVDIHCANWRYEISR
ncbi:hypothetical protein NPIL_172471 [Nephila pilipes]|uniref:Uncharacterized protein n=1 Tax=Nephila pilipes TaxID=299642 RepID=A0A8X6MWD0_NEPPI|nr:hypothetical protein NPIL_172471 [Nephila pilipes]